MKLTEVFSMWYAYCDWNRGRPVFMDVAFYVHQPGPSLPNGDPLQRFSRMPAYNSEFGEDNLDFWGAGRIAAHRSVETSPRGGP